MQTFQTTPAWVIVDQIRQSFELKTVEPTITEISEDIDLMIVIHPKDLEDETLYALDQFAMGGGRLLIFVDPMAEQDRPATPNPMMRGPQSTASDLNTLLSPWGVSLKQGVVLLDAQTALSVRGGPSGQPVRHLAILGMGPSNFSSDDVTISALESINFASAGVLEIDYEVETDITVLIHSSDYAQTTETMRLQFVIDPSDLQKDFKASGDIYPIAVRLGGLVVPDVREL